MMEQDLRTTPELVIDALRHGGEHESKFCSVVPLVVYDHDWQYHILIQEWDCFADERKWTYSLWFIDYEAHDEAIKVRDFPDHEHGDVPYVASALAVEEWSKSLQERKGQ